MPPGVDQHLDDGQELGVLHHEERGNREDGADQPHHAVDGAFRRDDQDAAHENERRQQVERNRGSHQTSTLTTAETARLTRAIGIRTFQPRRINWS